jgi:hypothetical protein
LEVRRYKALVAKFEAEAGGALREIDRGLLHQAAALVVKSELMQAAIMSGKEVDTGDAIRLASESRRIIEMVTGGRAAGKAKPAVVNGQAALFAHLAGKCGGTADDQAELAEADEA